MLENFNDTFEYKRLTEEEQSKRGILGRLVGVIADTKNPTRNGRKYNKELWEKVFNDPIMEEKIKNKVVFGELGHPSDRTETDISKAAIVLSEKPKLKRDGKLYGVFDILDTPNGRILKTLCDYGTTIGVSSRGEGDVVEDYDGQESVDPDTYSCECWDAVLLPAVKEARMQYVTESLNTKNLKEKLSEEVNKANDSDKEIMQETLEKLDIKLNEEEASYVATDGYTGCMIYKVGDNYTTTYMGRTVSSDNLERLLDSIRGLRDDDVKRWHDLDEQFYLNDKKIGEAKNKLKSLVNIEKLGNDLLDMAGEDEVVELIRKYLSKEERKGLGPELITQDELEAQYGVRDLKDLHEKFVEPSKEDLKPIEDKFAELGLGVEGKGRTLFGNTHYQLRKELDHKVTDEDLGPIFDALSNLDTRRDMPTTCSVGVHKDGDNIISASVDVMKKYVPDEDLDEALSNKELRTFAKAFIKIDDEDDLLNHIKEVISYDKDLGQSLMKINKEGGSVAYRAKKMSDLLWSAFAFLGEAKQDKSWVLYFDKDGYHSVGSEDSIALNGDKESIKKKVLNHEVIWPNDAEGFIILSDAEFRRYNDEDIKNSYEKAGVKLDKDIPFKESENKATGDQKLSEEVVNNQSNNLLSDLTEALKDKSDLEASVADIQNKLAVSDAKVESLEEELNKYKGLSIKLSLKAKESKELSQKVAELQESLGSKDKTIKQLKESRVKFATKTKSLNESISNKDSEVQKLNESLAKKDDEVKKLTEDLEEALANSDIQEKQHKDEVQRLSKLAEGYKKVANGTMRRYIESKATMYGLSFKDIRRRLPESYTADDVDKICESMRSYSINSMRLPINTGARMKFTESKNDHLRVVNPEDEVDEDLLNLANSF